MLLLEKTARCLLIIGNKAAWHFGRPGRIGMGKTRPSLTLPLPVATHPQSGAAPCPCLTMP
jgi:hypothetical protein